MFSVVSVGKPFCQSACLLGDLNFNTLNLIDPPAPPPPPPHHPLRTFSKLLTLYPIYLLASRRLVFDGEGLLVDYDFVNILITMVLKAISLIRNDKRL